MIISETLFLRWFDRHWSARWDNGVLWENFDSLYVAIDHAKAARLAVIILSR